jgi:predicted esterase YcpF (UPF0227 family)
MKKLIVYFHGLNSSPSSEKVGRLRAMYPDDLVYAFRADIDPDFSMHEISEQIESVLVEHFNTPGSVSFIGTSLGAWLASKMSDVFNVRALLINPCYSPSESLKKYPDISDSVREKYTDLDISFRSENKMYVIDPHDEVIDMRPLLNDDNLYDSKVLFRPPAGHRFNGPEFESVVKQFIGS